MPNPSFGQSAQVHYVGQSTSNSYRYDNCILAELVAIERAWPPSPNCYTIIAIDGGMSVALRPDGILIRARAGVI